MENALAATKRPLVSLSRLIVDSVLKFRLGLHPLRLL